MDKLAKKMTTFTVAVSAAFLISMPVFAAAPSGLAIDYDKEQVTGVDGKLEYSFDKSRWVPVFGTALDISKEIGSVTEIYVQAIGNTKEVDIAQLSISQRPSAPTGLAFASNAAGTHADTVNTGNTHEYKIGNLDWTDATTDLNVGAVETEGGALSVRLAAVQGSSAFASESVEVEIPKQRPAPSVTYDPTTDSMINVDSTMQYFIGTAFVAGTDSMSNVSSGVTEIDRTTLGNGTKGDKRYAYIRIKGASGSSSETAASAVAKIQIPPSYVAEPTVVMDMTNEKITGTSSLMEYRVLNVAQAGNSLPYDGTGVTSTTYSAPEWSSITGSVLDIRDLVSASTVTGNDVVKSIQVRTKAKPGTSTTVATPASAIKTFVVGQRPATPTDSDITLDYTDEEITINAANEYKIGATTAWTTGAANVSIASKIPSAGKDALAIAVRVKAAKTGSDPNYVYTPASEVYLEGVINARPATPTLTFDTETKKVTIDGVSESAIVNYQVNTVTPTVDIPAGTAAKQIELASYDGTTASVKVKVLPVEESATAESFPATTVYTKTFAVPKRSLKWVGGAFEEPTTYDGSVVAKTTATTATLTNEKFISSIADGATFSADTHYTLAGSGSVPAGLTLVVTKTSANVATVTFTGTASTSGDGDDLTGAALTIVFTNAAFADNIAISSANGNAATNLTIDFKDEPTLVWTNAGAYEEDEDLNDGTVIAISAATTATLDNDTFTTSVGATTGKLIKDTHYTVTGTVPAGLSLVVSKASATTATISFVGKANPHTAASSITGTNLQIKFKPAAFTRNAGFADMNTAQSLTIAFVTNVRPTTVTATAANPSPVAGASNIITITAQKAGPATITHFNGTMDITVAGVEQATGSWGTADSLALTGASSTVPVTFRNGVATLNLKLNKAATNTIVITVDTIVASNLVITPVADTVATLTIKTAAIAGARSTDTAVVFATVPVITLKDKFGNVCATGASETASVTATVKSSAPTGATLGTATAAAVAGEATLTGMTLTPGSDADITGLVITYTAGGKSVDQPSITAATA